MKFNLIDHNSRLAIKIQNWLQKMQPRMSRLLKKDPIFTAVVLAPTLCAILYFGLIASDVYISESMYIVRSPSSNHNTSTGLGSLLNTVGISNSNNDSYVVANYIQSMDALLSVNRAIDLKSTFQNQDIDLFNRFGSFYRNTSLVRLFNYFQKHIDIEIDPSSSVSTLTVSAYTPQSSQKINQELLASSESLINTLNERSRQDLITFSSKQIAIAKTNLERANKSIEEFRNSKSTKDDPNFVAKFQALDLERKTAEVQLNDSITALKQSQIEAERKKLYIERIEQPTSPDYPEKPKRIRGILTTFLFSLMLWGIIKVLVAGTMEHMD